MLTRAISLCSVVLLISIAWCTGQEEAGGEQPAQPEEDNALPPPETPPESIGPNGVPPQLLPPPGLLPPGLLPPGLIPPGLLPPGVLPPGLLPLILPTQEVPAVLYEDTWESLDTRPVPDWYEKGKIGVVVHYGLYSVIGVGSEWFWWSWQGEKKPPYIKYVAENFKPQKTYFSFTEGLTASFYNPAKWAELFEHAGARYAIISAKHHDGYSMWPSPYSQHWNSLDSGPGRDIVGDFIFGVRQNSGMKAGVLYSMFEWFNPLYLMDKNNNFSTAFYPATKALPELKDLVERYSPDIVWTTGASAAPDYYWNSTVFLKWLYNESPVRGRVVTNDRWGDDTSCKHGGVLTCGDNFNPREKRSRKWEQVTSMDKFSWGFRRNAHVWDILKTKDLVKKLVETVSCGGNLLINVGATADGLINPLFEDRLLEFGKWLDVNGEGIYVTTPWSHVNDTLAPGVWYTQRRDEKIEGGGYLYALVLKYPIGKLVLGLPRTTEDTKAILLGFGQLKWSPGADGGMEIDMPVLQQLTGPPHGWVVRISRLENF